MSQVTIIMATDLNFIVIHYIEAFAVNGSSYATASRTVQLTNVFCNESQQLLNLCDKRILSPTEGAAITGQIDVAGVSCVPTVTVTSHPEPPSGTTAENTGGNGTDPSFYAVIGVMFALLIASIVAIVG